MGRGDLRIASTLIGNKNYAQIGAIKWDDKDRNLGTKVLLSNNT